MACVLCVYMYDWMLNEISYVEITHAASSAVDAAKSYDHFNFAEMIWKIAFLSLS